MSTTRHLLPTANAKQTWSELLTWDQRERDLARSAQARAAIEQIDAAIEKIHAGTYGQCEVCGNPIGKNRLMAFQRATLCLSCKQREERR